MNEEFSVQENVSLNTESDWIRHATEEDIVDCVSVIREAFTTVADTFGFTSENAPGFTAFSTDEKKIRNQLCVEKRPIYVYEREGKIIGYYSLELISEDMLELNNLSVLPEYRHQGIGEKLGFEHKGCKKFDWFPFTCGFLEKEI